VEKTSSRRKKKVAKTVIQEPQGAEGGLPGNPKAVVDRDGEIKRKTKKKKKKKNQSGFQKPGTDGGNEWQGCARDLTGGGVGPRGARERRFVMGHCRVKPSASRPEAIKRLYGGGGIKE